MATKYTIEEINEFPIKEHYKDVLEKDISIYFDGVNWKNATTDVPIEIQNRVNTIFDKVYTEYPNRIVIGFKNAFNSIAKKAIEIRRELGYGDDIEKFFYDFGFYYDMGPIAQYLAEKVKDSEGEGENPYANLEPTGAALIDLNTIKVGDDWLSISGKVYDEKLQKRINEMCEKLLLWYPARVVINLQKEHKKFAEGSLLSIRRACGYDNNNEFLADFGFEYGSKSVGNSIFPGERKVEIINYLKNDSKFQEYYTAMEYPNILYSSKSIYDKDFQEYLKELSGKLKVSIDSLIEYVRQHSESQLKELSRRKIKINYNIDSIKVEDFDELKTLTKENDEINKNDHINKMFKTIINFDVNHLNEHVIRKAIDSASSKEEIDEPIFDDVEEIDVSDTSNELEEVIAKNEESEQLLKEYDEEKYKLAESLYNESNYVKALSIYKELEEYKDSKEKVSLIEIKQAEIAKEEKYKLAESLYNESNYVKALSIYKELEEYKDSKEKISLIKIKQIEIAKEGKYKLAESLYNESDYFQALILYKELEEYKDSKEKVSLIENKQAEIAKEEKYKLAESLYNESNYIKALSIYKEIEEYKDSKEKISLIEIKQAEIAKEEKYNKAVALIKNGSYKSALRILKELNGYKESNELTLKCNSYILEDDNYKKALELSDNAKYDEAYELIKECNNEKNIKLSLELKQKLELFEKYNEFNYEKATVVELQNSINELKKIKEYKNVNELISLYSQQISRIEKKKSISKLGLIIGGIASVVTLIIVLIVTIVVPNNKYEDALYKVNNKDYDSAEELLISLNGHKDSEDILLIISALKELDSNLENGVNKLLELNVKVTADYKSSIESNLPSIEFTDKYYSKEHNSNKYNLITWELTDYVVELNSSYSVNLELKGIYDEKEFNISYVLDGGTISNDYPTQYKYGNSLDLPIPYKKGYEFIGWNSDNKTFYINSDNTIKNKSYGDVVLTATYKANDYKVTFDTNGGTMSTGQTTFDTTITYGNVVEVSEPTKIGYKFIGWYYGDVKLNLKAFNIAEDCLIKAKWEIINYKIEYIGDDINIENPSTITYEDVVTLNPVEKTGYSFIGWRYNGETHEELELINVTNDITLEALFKPNYYTITLDPNGGISNLNVNINYYISGKLYTTQTLKPGEKVELLYLTNGNSIISGWYLDPEYRNKFDERNPVETDINLYGYYSSTEYINPNSYSSGRPYNMTCPIMGSSNTIYIRSKVSGSFTIYYKNASTTTDYNGDKETYISISNRTSGKTYVSKEILKSKEGYSSVTVSCLQGDEISISCWKVKSSGTGWNLNIYFSGYNNNSSDIVVADEINKIDVTYDSKITLPTPTKEGYKFIGWYLNDKLFTDELYVIADNIKLIAKWE